MKITLWDLIDLYYLEPRRKDIEIRKLTKQLTKCKDKESTERIKLKIRMLDYLRVKDVRTYIR